MSSLDSAFERLPATYKPHLYTLHLYPSANDFMFYGKVKINVELFEDTNNFVLNCKNIDICYAEAQIGTLKGFIYFLAI